MLHYVDYFVGLIVTFNHLGVSVVLLSGGKGGMPPISKIKFESPLLVFHKFVQIFFSTMLRSRSFINEYPDSGETYE